MVINWGGFGCDSLTKVIPLSWNSLSATKDAYAETENDGYTAASWEAFDTAFRNAATEIDPTEGHKCTTQEAIDALETALKTAAENLEKVANYERVDAAMANADKLVQADYTAESWANLREVLENVEFGLGEKRQDVVEKMAADINAAIQGLVPIFEFNKDTGTITRYNGTGTDVTIPDKIGNSAVKAISMGAFQGSKSLTSVTIPKSVKSIVNNAFKNCTSLKSVMISEGVTSIGNNAFEGCDSLTSVTIPESVTSIGKFAFRNCTSLKSVMISEGVKTIGEEAFSGCTGLTSVTIPEGVTSIGKYVFKNCTRLKSVTIPKTMESIGQYTFAYCTGLTSVTIPVGVESIKYGAFYRCESLTSVTVLATDPPTLGSDVFLGIPVNSTLTVPCGSEDDYNKTNWKNSFSTIVLGHQYGEAEPNCDGTHTFTCGTCSEDITEACDTDGEGGACSVCKFKLFDFNSTTGTITRYNGTGTDVTIPEKIGDDDVKVIGAEAFENNQTLVTVTIPEGVTSIGKFAFYYCENLLTVKIPTTVTQIGDNAFDSCTGLTSVTIPEGVKSIGECAFYCCENLLTVTISEGVESIGFCAFAECTGLKSVTIPASVESIGYSAFDSCTGLTSVTISEGVKSIGEYAFYNCVGLKSVTIPASVESIDSGAFDSCTGLTSVTVLATNPPTLEDDVFSNIAVNPTLTVHTPTDCLAVYQDSDWSSFTTIEAAEHDTDGEGGCCSVCGYKAEPADYSAVDAAIAVYEELCAGLDDMSTYYTEDSVKAVNEAIAAVVRDKPSTEQQDVNQFAKNICEAIMGLKSNTNPNANTIEDVLKLANWFPCNDSVAWREKGGNPDICCYMDADNETLAFCNTTAYNKIFDEIPVKRSVIQKGNIYYILEFIETYARECTFTTINGVLTNILYNVSNPKQAALNHDYSAFPIAKIGDNVYTSLTDAALVAKPNDAIVLQANSHEGFLLPVNVYFFTYGKYYTGTVYAPTGYMVSFDGFKYWVEPIPAAMIGETEYPTLEEAVAAAKSGETIKLLADSDESFTLPVGVTFATNGNSYTGTVSAPENYEVVTAEGVYTVCNHPYGMWVSKDATTHSRTCDMCGKTETAEHNWNAPSFLWTFAADGTFTVTCRTTCSVCGYVSDSIELESIHASVDGQGNNVYTADITIGGVPYTETKTVAQKYTVTLTGDCADFAGAGSYDYMKKVTITPPEGDKNAYNYTLNGAPVAFNATTLTFQVVGDMEIGVSLYEEPEEIKPSVVISTAVRTETAEGKYKIPFTLTWSIPKECEYTLVEAGYYYRKGADGGEDYFPTDTVLATGSVKKSKLTSLNGSYKCTHNYSSSCATRNIYAVGYIIVENAEGEQITFYADEMAKNAILPVR